MTIPDVTTMDFYTRGEGPFPPPAIPVIWLSLHDGILARGYWDQLLLEDLFARTLWRPVGALDLRHHVLFGNEYDPGFIGGFALEGGAIVVLPARHHVEDAEQINALLAPLPWVLMILTGDEAHEFDWRALSHPNMKVWVMTPDSSAHRGVDRKIGTGHARVGGWTIPDGEAAERPLAWFFAGQVTHERRTDCVRMFKQQADGEAVETESFTAGLHRNEYQRRLASAKIAPCPSGPESPDTFRFWEALEVGCLPIADGATPHGPSDFWAFLFDTDTKHLPFPIVEDWGEVTDQYAHWLAGWPANANRCFAWWQRYKRQVAYWLDADVRALANLAPFSTAVEDQVTVIITTSPTASHPSISAIVETIRSVRRQPGLGDCEIIIVADGVRPEQEHYRPRYEEYLRHLLWQINHHEHNIVPLILDGHHHQANATRRALELVETPFLLFMEHDTPILGDIDWDGLLLRLGEDAFVIRLYHELAVHPDHAHLMIFGPTGDPPLIKTAQWSQRPHLARVEFYRRMLDTYFGRDSRTMIEDVMHGVVTVNYREYGEDVGWGQFQLWLYAPDPDNMQRSKHLDSRGDDPKYDMIFDYGGGPSPVGAPPATPPRNVARRAAETW